jgi:hypothetical protein
VTVKLIGTIKHDWARFTLGYRELKMEIVQPANGVDDTNGRSQIA